jgi:hypothetical protein
VYHKELDEIDGWLLAVPRCRDFINLGPHCTEDAPLVVVTVDYSSSGGSMFRTMVH